MSTTQRNNDGLIWRLLPVVLLVWIYVFLRVHAIQTLPFFVDEVRHIQRARVVWTFSDIDTSTRPSKFLLYYWLGLFDLPLHLPQWLARTGTALFTVLGAAGLFALARTLFSYRTALLALLVLTFLPFMMFYDRLALTDPAASSFVVLVTWWSVLTVRNPTRHYSVILGILVSLMLAAKVLTVPMLILPVTAALFLGKYPLNWRHPRQQIRRCYEHYRSMLWTMMAVVGVIWGIILGFYQIRRTFTDTAEAAIVNPYLYDSVGITANLERIVQILERFFGPVLLIIIVVALLVMLWRRPNITLYLLSGGVPLAAILVVIAKQLSTRYLTLMGHLWIVLVVGGVVSLREILRRYGPLSWVPAGLLAVWVVGFGGSFWLTLIDEPRDLNLPDRDRVEYFSNQTGYGLTDALHYVAELEPLSEKSEVPVVVGLVRNCSFMSLYIPADLPLKIECSVISYHHADEIPPRAVQTAHLRSVVDTYGSIYVIIERDEPFNPQVDFDRVNGVLEGPIKVFERPFDGVPVELYRMTSCRARSLPMFWPSTACLLRDLKE